MNITVAFYVHHHGSGHFMRCLEIAKHLMAKHPVVLMGSGLKPYADQVPKDIRLLHLPLDTPTAADTHYREGNATANFHHVPLNVAGQRERNAMMTALFNADYPMLLVVDVSVEVTQLARLCGVPTVVIRQHGTRNDLPHQLAYRSAAMLIAPFGQSLETASDVWLTHKTCYSGGFSRYQRNPVPQNELQQPKPKEIGILVGTGGTSIDHVAVDCIAAQCSDLTFHVLGALDVPVQIPNVTFHGRCEDIAPILSKCYVVIGNTGHNTVMELAALQKAFIGIPEDRPFDEQLDKSKALLPIKGYAQVLPDKICTTDWKTLLAEMQDVETELPDLIADDALEKIAACIETLGNSLYR